MFEIDTTLLMIIYLRIETRQDQVYCEFLLSFHVSFIEMKYLLLL